MQVRYDDPSVRRKRKRTTERRKRGEVVVSKNRGNECLMHDDRHLDQQPPAGRAEKLRCGTSAKLSRLLEGWSGIRG
jgi:hypothetical protein